ncbi:SDR family oxidoreductase [Schleiferilactobacillus harbinensis]|jgi:NADP-dependent 3-hydroxy acid dehydrogenase YdfG|uniref:SDR family oxidoreductase n=1 Tax=Schleiferilactobacillus harbinensis TaxID=304207 RepID=UPI002671A1BA|nr:SDR family oxidoreductase [Schleiferilactobacillus harbinensis]MCI1783711.1 SDR family oxidoreductase [Schleiferilactobacillus harbinensis]
MSKVIVITGASSGIGEATAKLLAKQGNPVVLAARRASRLQAIVKDIEAAGGQAAYQETDVTDRQQVQSLADFALSKFGKIDVWMNNAGLMPQSTFDQLKVDEWDRMVDVNIKGVLYGIAAALPVMRKQQSGQFINLSSVAGHVVHAGSGVYAGTKFAVRAISDGLRQEEAAADSHTRVTVISPGAVATELPNTITDPATKKNVDAFYAEDAIAADRIAEAVAYAIAAPEDTSINEILIRPTKQIV